MLTSDAAVSRLTGREDLTQGLFASLLEHDFLDVIDPEKGRFRSFLLAACRNFLANQREREQTCKRGGGRITLSINLPDAEGRYALEPSHEITPELLFQRRWALTILDQVLDRLGEEMERSGKSAIFDRLKAALLGDGTAAAYREVADALKMTEDAVKMAALRLRRRYARLVREEVARTVADPAEVEDEIRDLFRALSP